jgi:hypothetical protein
MPYHLATPAILGIIPNYVFMNQDFYKRSGAKAPAVGGFPSNLGRSLNRVAKASLALQIFKVRSPTPSIPLFLHFLEQLTISLMIELKTKLKPIFQYLKVQEFTYKRSILKLLLKRLDRMLLNSRGRGLGPPSPD